MPRCCGRHDARIFLYFISIFFKIIFLCNFIQFEYRIKWVDEQKLDWIPIELMNCDERIAEFEKSRLQFIVGARSSSAGIEYAIKLRDSNEISIVQSSEFIKLWSDEIIDYLEGRIEFKMPLCRSVAFADAYDDANVTGKPHKILGGFQ